MTGYIINRLVWGIFTVFVVSVIVFLLMFRVPQEPAKLFAGKNPTPELVEEISQRYCFDKSAFEQYLCVAKDFVTGDIERPSDQAKIIPMVLQALPVTLSLTVFAVSFWMFFGVLIGIKGAKAPGTRLDSSLTVAALIGISMPVAWFALMMLLMWTDLIPVFPAGSYMTIAEGGIIGWAWHLVLPALTLAVVFTGIYARMTRTNVRAALGEEHVRTATAKGLPAQHVFKHHVLRTGLIPIVVMLGLDIAGLMSGAIFTETVFGLPGLGMVLANGLASLDMFIVTTCAIVAVIFVVIANLVVDLVQAMLDPRIRLGSD